MADKKTMIIGISGSLRKGSFNSSALRTAKELAGESAEIEIMEIGDLPFYSLDTEFQAFPEKVKALKSRIEAADAVLIASPEFDYSVPAALKNALEWINRPYGKGSLNGKPVAIMSASNGKFGGVRAQAHLRQVLLALNANVLTRPEVMIAGATEKFDQNGNLTDQETRNRIKELVDALVKHAANQKR